MSSACTSSHNFNSGKWKGQQYRLFKDAETFLESSAYVQYIFVLQE